MADEPEKPSDHTRAANQSLPPKRRQQQSAERGRGDEGFDDRVSYLASRLDSLTERLGGGSSAGTDAPASAPAPIRERRFSRSGTVNGEDGLNELLKGGNPTSIPTVPLNERVTADDTTPGETPRPTAGRVAAPRAPGISAASHRRRLKVLIIGAQFYGVTLLVLGFAVGWIIFADRTPSATDPNQPSATQKKATDGLGPVSAGDYALQAADTALKAEREGDLEHANQLFSELSRQEMVLPGLNYRLAILGIRRGDVTEGDLRLLHSIRDGEEVSRSYYARATFAAVKGDYTNATRSFDAAAHADPFSSMPFFYWAECLRRDGKPLAALTRFEEALNRPLLDADADYIRFKRDLAKVETGTDTEFMTGLTEKARQPTVSGDTWLLTAANDVNQGAFAAAADHLERASKNLSPAEFALKIADYLFQTQRERPALAAILANARPTPKADPASWGIQEGDPGTWPAPKMAFAH